jgi:hypothetical protein
MEPCFIGLKKAISTNKKDKVDIGHPCTGTEALYKPYAHRGSRGIALPLLDHDTRRRWSTNKNLA